MGEVMRYLADRDLPFVDSRTTADSLAVQAARVAGVPAYERDVFLDNEQDDGSIRAALQQGLKIARERGHAILIGHVQSASLARVLREEYSAILDAGYTFAALDDIPRAGARER
jgi:polysaccharide deacetylase 2 family uncharacterized protein YibQ